MEASWQLTEEAEEQRLAAEARAARLEDELRELRDRTFSLESQVEQMRSAAEENAGLRRAVDARLHTREMPSTVEDVVDYFSLTYADRLVFSDDAIRSLKSCVLEPAVLWEIFYALATCMRDLFLSGSGDIWKAFQTKMRWMGWSCSRHGHRIWTIPRD